MNKNFIDKINTIEKESKAIAELEKKIQSLEEEINRQRFTIKEQKLLIENLRNQMKNEDIEKAELPSEIDILKEIITSQRQELDKKNKKIEKLNDKLFELNAGLDSEENLKTKYIESDEFLETQKLILQLTNENENQKNQIEYLKTQIDELQSEKILIEKRIEKNTAAKIDDEINNFKRLNFHLMEENGLLRGEIESLKRKLNVQTEIATSEEFALANNKISILTSEIEDLEAQVKYLQENQKEKDEPIIISTEDALEFAKLRDNFDITEAELLKQKNENQNLKDIINELKTNMIIYKQKTEIEIPKIKNLSKHMEKSLFFRMYILLDEYNKHKVINYLIEDLKTGNYQVKRNSIKILSVLKNKKVYDTFLKMINDKDWIIRYFIIKALSTFEDKNNELKYIFKGFLNDADVDVRELAIKILKEFPE
ncbi:MAG: HEAT repeat domain-containing protein [Candidatus Odinarchaeota archaeon]